MESSAHKSGSFVLKEQVNDLESKLSQCHQALKAKEHVVGLQQEQIKKLSDMYKQCLDDLARVNCEHKKTLNDLDNLRIILKSYEKKPCYNEISSQTIPEAFEASPLLKQTENLQAIKDSLKEQSEKSNEILNILQSTKTHNFDLISGHVEDLKRISECLLESYTRRCSHLPAISSNNQRFPSLSPIIEENSNLFEEICIIDTSTQTICNVLTSNSSTNIPEQVSSSKSQTEIFTLDESTNTQQNSTTNITTQCDLIANYPSIVVQYTIYDEILSVRRSLAELQLELDINENLCEKLASLSVNCQHIFDSNREKESIIACLQDDLMLCAKLLEETCTMTSEEVKKLAKEITLQATGTFTNLLAQHNNLQEQNEMLLIELTELKSSHSEFPRIIVELINQEIQTDKIEILNEEQHRQQVVNLSRELADAYSSLKCLKTKNDQLEKDVISFGDLKNLFLKMNMETVNLYRSQLQAAVERNNKYEREISILNGQLLQNKIDERQLMCSSTQIYGWAPMAEQTDVLRAENEELIKRIFQLKQEINGEKLNWTSFKELEELCLQLGQEVKLPSCYQEQLEGLRKEIVVLRGDNKQLASGVQQLQSVIVELEHRQIDLETSEISSSNECIPITNRSQQSLSSSSTDLEQLKSLCKDLSSRLQHKRESHHHQADEADERFALLVSLENDLKILMQEFLDFKWSSKNEYEKLLASHSGILQQNKELVDCVNQYKGINESLLETHYELERAKSEAMKMQQDVLEDYMKLQEKFKELMELNNKRSRCTDCSVNTVLLGRDVIDAEYLKLENRKLCQEVENLLKQIDDQHAACFQHLQEQVMDKTCSKCETTFSALETLNGEFNKLSVENDKCKDLLLKRENEIEKLQNVLQEVKMERDQLLKDLQRMQSHLKCLNTEKEEHSKDINLLQNHCKELRDELMECQERRKKLQQEIEKCHEQINMLQNIITKIGPIKEQYSKLEAEAIQLKSEVVQKDCIFRCNNNLKLQLNHVENELKQVSEAKERVELEFESYIRTNNLLQQTLNTQIESLTQELKSVKAENDSLQLQVNENTASKAELIRVVNECAAYKMQLDSMAKRIDLHMKEHLDYKSDVDEVKRSLETEIENLRRMLDVEQNYGNGGNGGRFEINDYQSENSGIDVDRLRDFVKEKEVAIDGLMTQKLHALDVLGQITSRSRDEFKVRLNFRQTPRDLHSSSQHTHGNPRSASVPRMSKSGRKNCNDRDGKPDATRPFATRKTHSKTK